MGKIKIGYKRLYDSAACVVENDKPYREEFANGGRTVTVFIGQDPPLGLGLTVSERYYYAGHPKPFSSIIFGRKDIGSIKHLDAVTEICCLEEIEISDETLIEFKAENPQVQQELLALAEAKKIDHASLVDLVAGAIGLHFHKQIVIEALSDAILVVDSVEKITQSYVTRAIEMLEPLKLLPGGYETITKVVEPLVGAPKEDKDFGATAMFWLLRSWAESDIYSKFMSLFVPIEVVLSRLEVEGQDETAELDAEIQAIIKKEAGDRKRALLERFNRLKQLVHPPLARRFEQMAEIAKIDGWESDVIAFRKFNALRNRMLHSGNNDISTIIETTDGIESEVRDLEDIAERYVLWALFRRKEPYKSKYRAVRKPG